MGAAPSEPAPAPSLELEKPWRKFNWGQKEELKQRLEKFSLSNPDVNCIKILVAGQIGAGKSSFINSVNNIFQGRITSSALVDSCGGTSFTKELKAHRVRGVKEDLPFYLIDIMGLEPETLAGSQPEDVIKAISGHVKDEYKFTPEKSINEKSQDYVTDPSLSEQAFCLVYVVDAHTIQYIDRGLVDKLKTIRHAISDDRIPQVLIMTKVDEACPLVKEDLRKIYTSKKIKQKMEMCSEAIGVPKNFIFPVKLYCEEIDTDDNIDVLILKAFEQIVNLANDRLREYASKS